MLRTKMLAGGAAIALMAVLTVLPAANAEAVSAAAASAAAASAAAASAGQASAGRASAGCSMTPARVLPGRSATFSCAPGTFVAGEHVRFTIAGTSGASVPVAPAADANVAVNGSSATTVRLADRHGGSHLRLHALRGGSGTVTVTLSGASRMVTSRLTVGAADGIITARDPATGTDLAAAGPRADAVFGWVLTIIVAFAAVAFLSQRGRERNGGGPAEA